MAKTVKTSLTAVAPKKKKGGKKARKYGRNKKACEAYQRADRVTTNRRKRWIRTIRRQPENDQLRSRFKAEFGDLPADLRV